MPVATFFRVTWRRHDGARRISNGSEHGRGVELREHRGRQQD
jgi:hypothetical protein